ncbi:MAG TPA: hypothetical protein VK171_14330 [Fimbriimonas sp.]|nr:hypothetical protein [Fimbriimonas sp.]
MTIEAFDGETNMRLDTEMFERVTSIETRVYRWSEVCITIGRNQEQSDATDNPAVSVIKRPTGGAAVLHGHDLTVSIAATLSHLGCSQRDVRAIYGKLVDPVLEALNQCGVPADYGGSGRSKGRASTYCFATSSVYDVISLMTGAKICGCALRVTRDRALLQVSIPTSEPKEEATKLIKNFVALPPCRLDEELFAGYFRSMIPKSMC